MAGSGSRFEKSGYDMPKPLIHFHGKTMIQHAIDTLGIKGRYIFCVHADHCKKFNLDKKLKKLYENCEIVIVESLTDGPASTAMLAKRFFENDKELIIANCDQYMMWEADRFRSFLNTTDADGVLVTYYAQVKHNSYARVKDDGYVDLVKEKEVISKYSTNGIHYWRKGKYFCEAYHEMVKADDRTNGEFYVAPSYNYMISKGLKVRVYDIDPNQHFGTGTPKDLQYLLEKLNQKG